MATEQEVKKTVDEILKLTEKAGGWVEETTRSIRSGKVNMIEVKISFKVT